MTQVAMTARFPAAREEEAHDKTMELSLGL